MNFIKQHPVISIIGLLILLAIIGAFLPNKQSENLQEVNQTLDESTNIQNNLIPYTDQSCEDIKPNIAEMRIMFNDGGGERYSGDSPILKDGEELIMYSSCGNGECSGYKEYNKYDRDEEGNKLQEYKLTYYLKFIPEECSYNGDSGIGGIYKTCKVSNITCKLEYI